MSLSLEQKYAVARFQSGQNIFVTGPGGTGKTRLIRHFTDILNEQGKKYQVCALTGCAAILLGCKAKTIHSWSGIRLAKGRAEDIADRIIKNRMTVKAWKNVEVLIVDEISMLSARVFEVLDHIGQKVRKDRRPFGGIQVIFTGDFFQLPPIPDYGEETRFCFQSPRWPAVFARENCIQLTTAFRQSDPLYVSILNEIRQGRISPENEAVLRNQMNKEKDADILPAKLFPVRQKVEFVNSTTYAALEGEERNYAFTSRTTEVAYLETSKPIPAEVIQACRLLPKEEKDAEIDRILSHSQMEKVVSLKVGASVMCTTNIDVTGGICNGSQGIVVGFDAITKYPLVRFSNMRGRVIPIEPQTRQSEDYPTISVSQIPLTLAWALTIHKIQGATLDMAEMDIGKSVFEYGQTYVALSRIRSLNGLYITDFRPDKIRANPDVVAFYREIENPSVSEMESYLIRTPVRPPSPLTIPVQKDPNIKTIRVR